MTRTDPTPTAHEAAGLEVPTIPGEGIDQPPVISSRRKALRPGPAVPCGRPTASGGRCGTARLPGREWCRFHTPRDHPDCAMVQAERRQGGLTQMLREVGLDLGPIDMKDTNDLRRVLAESTRAVASGRIPASVAGAISQLIGTALRVAEVEALSKIAALERQLEERTHVQAR